MPLNCCARWSGGSFSNCTPRGDFSIKLRVTCSKPIFWSRVQMKTNDTKEISNHGTTHPDLRRKSLKVLAGDVKVFKIRAGCDNAVGCGPGTAAAVLIGVPRYQFRTPDCSCE